MRENNTESLIMGRPLKFKSVKELQKKIDAYFACCEKDGEPLTITGLALALDTSRETLMEYGEREEFVDTIKKAKLKIEHAYELRNIKRGNAGDIFALKNFGWKDKTESDVTLGGSINVMPSVKLDGQELVLNIGDNPDVGTAGNT
jgi:hypothetical protein